MSDENHNQPKDETPIVDATVVEENTASSSSGGDHTMGMLCHLLSFCCYVFPFGNLVGPLVLWIIKKDEDAFVDATGKEVINFQISMTIYAIICTILMLVFIGIILLPIVVIANIVYTIIAAIKANEGVIYEYPFSIRFLK